MERPANDFAAVRPNLETTLDLSRELANYFPGYTHIADPLIDVAPGADTARMDTYAVVYQVPADADASMRTLGMRYVDDMVRKDGAWCIHHRVARMLWMR